MTETINRLGSIIGNFVKEKSKMVGLFYVDARKEPYDEDDQYSEMNYLLVNIITYILLILTKTAFTH